MFRSFQYPLNPTRRQAEALDRLLAIQSEAYNAALQERRDAWRRGVRVTTFEQFGQIKDLWQCRPDVMAYGVTVLRGTLIRLDRALQAFFRLWHAVRVRGIHASAAGDASTPRLTRTSRVGS